MLKPFSLLATLLLLSPGAEAGKRETISGPVEAEIVRVRDGDSIDVMARIWPGQRVLVSVRLRGIDAPELRAKCARELHLARAAASQLAQLVGEGPIRLYEISGGKYFGRVLARVETKDGQDPAKVMLAADAVRSYKSGRRGDWCDPQS